MKKYIAAIVAIFYSITCNSQYDAGSYFSNTKYEKGQQAFNKKLGAWKYYDAPGKLALEYDYDKDSIIFLPRDTTPYRIKINGEWKNVIPDIPPRYIGSMHEFYRGLKAFVNFTSNMVSTKNTETIYLTFDVNKKGVVKLVQIDNLLDKELDIAIRKGFKNGFAKWIPAQVAGKNCDARFMLPVEFKLFVDEREVELIKSVSSTGAVYNLETLLRPLVLEYSVLSNHYNAQWLMLDRALKDKNARREEGVKYYYSQYDTPVDRSNAVGYNIYKFLSDTGQDCLATTYNLDDIKTKETIYTNVNKKDSAYTEKSFYKNGKFEYVAHYLNMKLNGTLKCWYENGEIKREAVYKNDSVISGKCYTLDGKDTVYVAWRTMPEFPGGEEKLVSYLQRHVIYPLDARINYITGIVYLTFEIDTDGILRSPLVLKEKNTSLQVEALRVIRCMPDWIPGTLEGKRVNVRYNLPINFQLR